MLELQVNILEFQLKKLIGRTVLIIAGLGGGWALLYAGFMFIAQALTWLKTGRWPPRPISEWLWQSFYIRIAPTEWIGLNKILDWILSMHIAVLMLLIAIACFSCAGFGARIVENAQREIDRAREAKR